MKRNNNKLVQRIKDIIKVKLYNKNITQTELANRMGTSQQSINKDLSISTMEKLADSIGDNLTDLLPVNITQNNHDESNENINVQMVENMVVNDVTGRLDRMEETLNKIWNSMIKEIKIDKDKD